MPQDITSTPVDTTPEIPDWNVLRARVMHDLPTVITPLDEGVLEGCIFEMRQELLDALVNRYANDSVHQEDMLRDTLPPLDVPPGPFRPVFSAWHLGLAAVLGLICATAAMQGAFAALGKPPSGGLDVLAGFAGATLALWLWHTLGCATAHGYITLPWGRTAWLSLRRWLRLGSIVVLGAAVLRDFLGGRDVLADLLETVGVFLGQGNTLALLSNIYSAMGLLGLFALSVHRPVRLDREAFGERLLLAARNWWHGSSRAAEALAAHAARNGDVYDRPWRQVGRDLYSLAEELPANRRRWLQDRLHCLGLEAPRVEGKMVWEAALADRYESLGHLTPGDACFVDMPPLLENGRLLRKGTVRKIRG